MINVRWVGGVFVATAIAVFVQSGGGAEPVSAEELASIHGGQCDTRECRKNLKWGKRPNFFSEWTLWEAFADWTQAKENPKSVLESQGTFDELGGSIDMYTISSPVVPGDCDDGWGYWTPVTGTQGQTIIDHKAKATCE